MPEDTDPTRQAAQLQEAIDTIAQAFDHPSSLSIRYEVTDGEKITIIGQKLTGEKFELTFDGRKDDAEPELVRID